MPDRMVEKAAGNYVTLLFLPKWIFALTFRNDEGKISNATLLCRHAKDRLEVYGKVIEKDEEASPKTEIVRSGNSLSVSK